MLEATLAAAVERRLTEASGQSAAIVASRLVGGGSINRAALIDLDDGRRFFLKWNPAPLPQMFEREAEGLAALRQVGAIRVPADAVWQGPSKGSESSPPFLVMEAIATGSPGPSFFEDFGRRFAELHRRGRGERFGFESDNYLGSTPQPNGWCVDWVEFFARRRLEYQLRLAKERGVADRSLLRLGELLVDQLDRWLAEPAEEPALLHGDLWGGNYLIDDLGSPVLVDPAVYYGRREADLAMTRLFGGFEARFYDAYEEEWPLEAGAQERLEIYQLYHLLNHLNLFGGGYLGSCLAILRRLVG